MSANAALARFLDGLGLGHYAELLAEHAIDLDILPSLSQAELRELGMPPGDRQKLLAATRGLTTEHVSPPIRPPERRHVTVLFCDVTKSTDLAHRLDPEDFSDLLKTYAERTAAVINRFEGHVAKYMGDRVMAFFGFPIAHEDDAERAILAALDLRRIHRDTPIRIDGAGVEVLPVRIGIHTGQVVVGSFERGPGTEDDIFGEAPNIAQRLLLEAAPDDIMVSADTRALAGSRFEYVSLERRVLRGMGEPIESCLVLREFPARTRFDSRSTAALTPFVRRDHEIGRLMEHWDKAKTGRAEAVVISGPAGIGKSRLMDAFFGKIENDTKRIITLQCLPHRVDAALHPVTAWLRREAELSVPDGGGSDLDSLRGWLERAGLAEGLNLRLLASLLAVDSDRRLSPRGMDKTMRVLTDHIAGLSESRPLLLLTEDLQWADEATVALVKLVLAQCREKPVMVVMTLRDGTEQGEAMIDGATHYRLGPMALAEMVEVVRHAGRPRDLGDSSVHTIVERSDGIPLFAEELTAAVREHRIDGRALGDAPRAGDMFVPERLVGLFTARLDTLSAAKYLVQIAAAIGERVPQGLLRDVSEYDEARFRKAVQELADARMISGVPRDLSEPLVFERGLLLDVAYNLMLRRDRRRVHLRIAEAIEAEGQDVRPEVLARHYEAASRTRDAVRNLIAAGRGASANSEHVEALRYLEHASELLARRSGISGRDALRLELDIQRAKVAPLTAVKGQTAPETQRAFDRAEEIAASLSNLQDPYRSQR